MSNIADFEAREFYHKQHREWVKQMRKIRQQEEVVDCLMSFAICFFLTTWLITTFIAYTH